MLPFKYKKKATQLGGFFLLLLMNLLFDHLITSGDKIT
jgi:hypothetical protein